MCSDKTPVAKLHEDPTLRFLSGGGEMGEKIRAYDWSKTPLGDPATWPVSLKTAVSIMLNAAAPAYIAWGSGYVQLYNDAYSVVLGSKHPAALGITTRETWYEIWDFVGPLFENVIASGRAVSFENQLLSMVRHGYLEQCYFTFSYSPLMDEDGGRNGVFVTAWETTEHVVNQRRADHLKRISEKLSLGVSMADIRAVFEELSEECSEDLPFGLWYEYAAGRSYLELAAIAGIAHGTVLSPARLDLASHHFYKALIDPINTTSSQAKIEEAWLEWASVPPPLVAPHSVRVQSMSYTSADMPDAYLIFGLNPLRPDDDGQLKFCREVALQFENAVRRVNKSLSARREVDHQLHTVLKAVPCLVWMSDIRNTCFFFNQTWLDFRGRTLEEELNEGWADGIHPDDLNQLVSQHRSAFDAHIAFAIEYRLRRADGAYRWILDQSQPRYSLSGDFLGYIGTCLDITEHRIAESALRASEARYRQIVETAQEGILVIDNRGRTMFANPRLEQMLGLDKGEAFRRSIYEFMDPSVRDEVRLWMKERVRGQAGHHEYRLRRADGSDWWALVSASQFTALVDGSVGILAMVTDITDRKNNERQIEYLATHDFLTGLPNRNLLNDRISQAISLARRADLALAIIFIDLDHFKYVNDSYGHPMGDALLKVVARKLEGTIRNGDTVARLGGDEFVVLLTNLHNPYTDASGAADHLLASLALPLSAEGIDFTVTASFGIALYPTDGKTPDELLMHADTAMYRAKETGRGSLQFYNVEMSRRAMERTSLAAALRHAVDLHQFELHYQPQIRVSTGDLVGMEALIRWRHPERGLISPANFIPVAEETGLIVPIGDWVIRTACAQNKAWQRAGLPCVPISVNLCVLQLRQTDLEAKIAAALDETGLEPRYLDIEITETMLIDKNGVMLSMLENLTRRGVSLSIDDFGTGYSNLGYLSMFPVSTLKIDQSFVHGIPANQEASSIVSAIIGLGKSLGLRVIAEGVETQEQADFVAGLECEVAQGFLYSKPLPVDLFTAWAKTYIRLRPT
jgi:diguanylate cyclase (GGDEF)-like protein/PAS domain S-box-containing protein